jgi:hypothetical protein
MLTAFAKSELLSGLQFRRGIVPTNASPGTLNTYDASPQPAAGIDSWDAGYSLPRKLLIVVEVTSFSEAGSLVITLRDDNEAITTANGAANTKLAATLSTITAAGLYCAEIDLRHVFPATSARYIAIDAESGLGDNVAGEIARYHSIRGVADTATILYSVLCIYGSSSRGFPRAKHTALTTTFNDAA